MEKLLQVTLELGEFAIRVMVVVKAFHQGEDEVFERDWESFAQRRQVRLGEW